MNGKNNSVLGTEHVLDGTTWIVRSYTMVTKGLTSRLIHKAEFWIENPSKELEKKDQTFVDSLAKASYLVQKKRHSGVKNCLLEDEHKEWNTNVQLLTRTTMDYAYGCNTSTNPLAAKGVYDRGSFLEYASDALTGRYLSRFYSTLHPPIWPSNNDYSDSSIPDLQIPSTLHSLMTRTEDHARDCRGEKITANFESSSENMIIRGAAAVFEKLNVEECQQCAVLEDETINQSLDLQGLDAPETGWKAMVYNLGLP